MRKCGKKITLEIHGKERTFSRQELIAILEKYFSKEETKYKQILEQENQWMKVNIREIDKSLFEKKRKDWRQEYCRVLILEAFAEFKKNPTKYASQFYTVIPEKEWEWCKTVEEIKDYAISVGGKTANWAEQALEWAQRISNGESWEDVCNNPDTVNWYRLIVWKNGYARVVGGSSFFDKENADPAANVYKHDYDCLAKIYNTVPLVVYKNNSIHK